MAKYQGHRSWNAWNVSLWINTDEGMYRHARELVQKLGVERAALALTRAYGGEKTPDGAVYNVTCIREALRGIGS
jgi:hypothetical protein